MVVRPASPLRDEDRHLAGRSAARASSTSHGSAARTCGARGAARSDVGRTSRRATRPRCLRQPPPPAEVPPPAELLTPSPAPPIGPGCSEFVPHPRCPMSSSRAPVPANVAEPRPDDRGRPELPPTQRHVRILHQIPGKVFSRVVRVARPAACLSHQLCHSSPTRRGGLGKRGLDNQLMHNATQSMT